MIHENSAHIAENHRVAVNMKVIGNVLVATSCLMLFVCTTSLTAGIINHFVTEAHRSGRGVLFMFFDLYCFGNILLWLLVESAFGFLLAGSLTALFSSIFSRPRR
jgi:hypothetical protein